MKNGAFDLNNCYQKLQSYIPTEEIVNPKVSVIVPCYNSEKYISRCLFSLIRQSLKDIEIIIIDDGSNDSTPDILDEFKKYDKRIKVITQTNQKQGAARNRGLDVAIGEFITFVDADDWVDEDYIELLYNAAKKYNTNIAAASFSRDYKHKSKYRLKFDEEKVYKGAENIIKALKNNLMTCCKMYKFEPIKHLRFEEGVLFEDAPYTIRAIDIAQSMVTVPKAHYHYFSNPGSTIKSKFDEKNKQDAIFCNMQVCDYAEEKNIKMKDWEIYTDNYILWKIKYYKYHQDYYLFGIKIFKRNVTFNNNKVFLVYNTACFGDVLLCNTLVQNIKNCFPESKVIFITEKSCYDVAKYQEGVDEVIIYDKKGIHKGLAGIYKFIKEFPYKKPFASFVTYKNERNYIISKLLRSEHIFCGNISKIIYPVQKQHADLLQPLTNKIVKNIPIKYNPPVVNTEISGLQNDYIVLCTISKKVEKDMPVETAADLIKLFNKNTKYKVIFSGIGEKARNYAEQLKNAGCEFIDLTDKTNIIELANVIKNSKGLISVDTGTLHLGCAMSIPTTAVFYIKDFLSRWAPDKNIYNAVVISENQTADTIFNAFLSQIKK